MTETYLSCPALKIRIKLTEDGFAIPGVFASNGDFRKLGQFHIQTAGKVRRYLSNPGDIAQTSDYVTM